MPPPDDEPAGDAPADALDEPVDEPVDTPRGDPPPVTRTGGPPGAGSGKRAVDAVRPRGTLQIVVGVLAVCFLAGAVGFVIGTRTSEPPSSAVDVGFLVDMSDHHDQAIQMALCAADRATDPTVRHFAQEVLVFQATELGQMQGWLDQRDERRPDTLDRPAMQWMGMDSTRATMPGMATEADLKKLCTATGRDIDEQFLRLMREHHRGGVHMGDFARDHAADPAIAAFAGKLAQNQAVEINEYTSTLQRLGFE